MEGLSKGAIGPGGIRFPMASAGDTGGSQHQSQDHHWELQQLTQLAWMRVVATEGDKRQDPEFGVKWCCQDFLMLGSGGGEDKRGSTDGFWIFGLTQSLRSLGEEKVGSTCHQGMLNLRSRTCIREKLLSQQLEILVYSSGLETHV